MDARHRRVTALAAMGLAAVVAAVWFAGGMITADHGNAGRAPPETAALAAAPDEIGARRSVSASANDALWGDALREREDAIAMNPVDAKDASALDDARSVERDLFSRPLALRARLMAAMADEDFASLMHAFDVQMQNDAGALELARLFAEHVRGELPANGEVRLLDLRCGVRLCAATFETSSPDRSLPSLGYESLTIGHPLPDGGMSHRLVFIVDRDLRLRPPPAPPKERALALQGPSRDVARTTD